ncbi:MAG TPA: tetratricopeptide repeat protein [bacterium]|nr:tetratricopeptide repeat protein [bacterium]
MRRRNYAIILGLTAVLAGLLWYALYRFEQQDAAAHRQYNAVIFHWTNVGFDKTGDWVHAAAAARTLLADHPESQWAMQAAPLLVATLMNQGDDTAALAAAEQLGERYRGCDSEAQLWYLQGQCLKRLGRYPAANAALTICIRQFPETRAARDAAAVLQSLPLGS